MFLCRNVNITSMLNPTALRKAKIAYNFGLSECNRVRVRIFSFRCAQQVRILKSIKCAYVLLLADLPQIISDLKTWEDNPG